METLILINEIAKTIGIAMLVVFSMLTWFLFVCCMLHYLFICKRKEINHSSEKPPVPGL